MLLCDRFDCLKASAIGFLPAAKAANKQLYRPGAAESSLVKGGGPVHRILNSFRLRGLTSDLFRVGVRACCHGGFPKFCE